MKGELKDNKLHIWREQMKESLRKKLVEKYPKIFSPNFGFEHGDGWYWLIDKLCSTLQFQTDYNEMPQIEAAQVKEKFGTLRFYHKRLEEGTPDRAKGAISLAKEISAITCERCGTIGATKKDRNGWLSTLCTRCTIEDKIEDIDPEIVKSINENFWSLVGDEKDGKTD